MNEFLSKNAKKLQLGRWDFAGDALGKS